MSGFRQQIFALAVAVAPASGQGTEACRNLLVGSSQSPVLPDHAITASSQSSAEHQPWRSRMDRLGTNWAAAGERDEWLEFNFGRAVKITEVLTKGQHLADEWVTTFQLQFAGAANNWALLQEVFEGNVDKDSVKVNRIRPPLVATRLRIRPSTWHGGVGMRAELHGCEAKITTAAELACRQMRCQDGSAVGEGVQCCSDGICSGLATHTGLIWNQLYCKQQRYDELALLAEQSSWPAPAEVLEHARTVRLQKEKFLQDGFLPLREAISADAIFAALQSFEDTVWNSDRQRRPGCHLEISTPGSFAINRTVSLRSAPHRVRKRPYRMHGLHIGAEEPKAGPWNRIFYHANIVSTVGRLLGGPARLLQVLVFERGSQQAMHDDTWYLPGSDYRGGMIGVWVALDATDAVNGPFFYYPGSHKRTEYLLNSNGRSRKEQIALPDGVNAEKELQDEVFLEATEEIMRAGWQREVFDAAPGDVGFWHERLLHGGSNVADWSRTRRSVIMHFVLDQ